MNASITIDASDFSHMVRELQRISGASFRKVLLQETAALLGVCIKQTKAADMKGKAAAKARVAVQFNSFSAMGSFGGEVRGEYPRISVTSNAKWLLEPSKEGGRPAFYSVQGGDRQWRWNPTRWATYQSLEARRLSAQKENVAKAEKLFVQSRGLMKQSWMQVADDLGLSGHPALSKVPAYVRKAISKSGRTYKNGTGREVTNADAMYIDVANAQPILVNKEKGEKVLQSSLRIRQAAFKNALKHGVFEDLKARAQRYPGVFVLPT